MVVSESIVVLELDGILDKTIIDFDFILVVWPSQNGEELWMSGLQWFVVEDDQDLITEYQGENQEQDKRFYHDKNDIINYVYQIDL